MKKRSLNPERKIMNESLDKSSFPKELLDAGRFIIWFEDWRGEKLTKIPSAPWRTGHYGSASATDPENWVDFDTALKYAKGKEGRYVATTTVQPLIAGSGYVLEWSPHPMNLRGFSRGRNQRGGDKLD